jgi:hypothetical protein
MGYVRIMAPSQIQLLPQGLAINESHNKPSVR